MKGVERELRLHIGGLPEKIHQKWTDLAISMANDGHYADMLEDSCLKVKVPSMQDMEFAFVAGNLTNFKPDEQLDDDQALSKLATELRGMRLDEERIVLRMNNSNDDYVE